MVIDAFIVRTVKWLRFEQFLNIFLSIFELKMPIANSVIFLNFGKYSSVISTDDGNDTFEIE